MVKCLPAMRETQVRSLGHEDPLKEEMQPTPVPLPGKSHGQRSLVQATVHGVTKSQTRLHFHFHFQSLCYFSSSSSLISWLPYMFTHLFIFIDENTFVLSCFSHVWLFVTVYTIACQASLTMGFSRQEYWSGLPFPPSGDLPNPGIEPTSLMSPALAGRFFTTSITWEVPRIYRSRLI